MVREASLGSEGPGIESRGLQWRDTTIKTERHLRNRVSIRGTLIAPSFWDQLTTADMRYRTDLMSSAKTSGSSLGGHNMRHSLKKGRDIIALPDAIA